MPLDMAQLNSLSPEERAALKEALSNPPDDPMEIIASAIELLMAKVEAVEQKVDAVSKVVYDDFIGGIKELSDSRAKVERVSGIKSKYGSLFGGPGIPEYLSDHLGGNPDSIYDLIDEHLQKLKGGEGFTDEMGDSEIQKIAKEIGDRIAKITGKPVSVETTEVAAATPDAGTEPKAEEPKAEEKPPIAEEEDPMAKLKKHIGGMKERGGQAA